ncbi:MAG: GNAT family N-acetyltransferase [Crinalium sp.]
MKPNVQIREALPQEDWIIAEHFYRMWLDNNVLAESIEPNWQQITLEFIAQARHNLYYKAFVAEIEKQVIGSTSCQLFAGLYPDILKAEYRNYGYIWGVYIEPDYRKQGIGKSITKIAVDYLKSIGCTRAILNASPLGKTVYSGLGFSISNAMQLDLI